MTREQAEALGRRALAAGWRWSEGSMACTREGWGRVKLHREADIAAYYWPDFRDAATCGILLEQVREAWEDPWLYVQCLVDLVPDGDGPWVDKARWVVYLREEGDEVGEAGTYAEALVAALEAKP